MFCCQSSHAGLFRGKAINPAPTQLTRRSRSGAKLLGRTRPSALRLAPGNRAGLLRGRNRSRDMRLAVFRTSVATLERVGGDNETFFGARDVESRMGERPSWIAPMTSFTMLVFRAGSPLTKHSVLDPAAVVLFFLKNAWKAVLLISYWSMFVSVSKDVENADMILDLEPFLLAVEPDEIWTDAGPGAS